MTVLVNRLILSKEGTHRQSWPERELRKPGASRHGKSRSSRFGGRRRGGARYSQSMFGRGRTAFGRSRLSAVQRRVVVKARVARHQGRAFRSALLFAHVAYLERDVAARGGPATEDGTQLRQRAVVADVR
jgi:hypothetical protein